MDSVVVFVLCCVTTEDNKVIESWIFRCKVLIHVSRPTKQKPSGLVTVSEECKIMLITLFVLETLKCLLTKRLINLWRNIIKTINGTIYLLFIYFINQMYYNYYSCLFVCLFPP